MAWRLSCHSRSRRHALPVALRSCASLASAGASLPFGRPSPPSWLHAFECTADTPDTPDPASDHPSVTACAWTVNRTDRHAPCTARGWRSRSSETRRSGVDAGVSRVREGARAGRRRSKGRSRSRRQHALNRRPMRRTETTVARHNTSCFLTRAPDDTPAHPRGRAAARARTSPPPGTRAPLHGTAIHFGSPSRRNAVRRPPHTQPVSSGYTPNPSASPSVDQWPKISSRFALLAATRREPGHHAQRRGVRRALGLEVDAAVVADEAHPGQRVDRVAQALDAGEALPTTCRAGRRTSGRGTGSNPARAAPIRPRGRRAWRWPGPTAAAGRRGPWCSRARRRGAATAACAASPAVRRGRARPGWDRACRWPSACAGCRRRRRAGAGRGCRAPPWRALPRSRAKRRHSSEVGPRLTRSPTNHNASAVGSKRRSSSSLRSS